MIFVTVGTDLSFNRMVRVVDDWAHDRGRHDVFAQIGESEWRPRHIQSVSFLEPPEFHKRFREATLIISHAGMGTILSALLHGKPILVMPKLASLGEHRNEHQTATAKKMKELAGVNVAFNENELREALDHLANLDPPVAIGPNASDSLIMGLRDFIHGV